MLRCRRCELSYSHFSGLRSLLYWLIYRMSFLSRSLTKVKMPRLMTSRWVLENQFSTWLSRDQ